MLPLYALPAPRVPRGLQELLDDFWGLPVTQEVAGQRERVVIPTSSASALFRFRQVASYKGSDGQAPGCGRELPGIDPQRLKPTPAPAVPLPAWVHGWLHHRLMVGRTQLKYGPLRGGLRDALKFPVLQPGRDVPPMAVRHGLAAAC